MKRVSIDCASGDTSSATQMRDRVELLRSRLNLLTGTDRVLMEMHLDNGVSFRRLGQLTGLCETTISRRIRRLAQRLLDPTYMVCLRNRQRFSPLEIAIAGDFFVRGMAMTRIAHKRKMSYYRVREVIHKIRTLTDVLAQETNGTG